MKISVIGLGKAGLPLAAVIANAGMEVLGVDINSERVAMVNKGVNPLKEETGLSELIAKHGGKLLKATVDAVAAAKQCNVHIIIVPLFISENKKPEFGVLENALCNLAKGLKKNDTVILETTVPIGTTERLLKAILEKYSGLKAGIDFSLAHSPERIMTGYSISRFKEFSKLVGGIDSKSTDNAFNIYKKFAKPIKLSNAKTAEFAKIAEGVYRDVNIALANELFRVAEHYGIDFWEIRKATKYKFCDLLEPGNVGGHCIPVYPWFLMNDLNVPLIEVARKLNDGMVNYFVDKVSAIGGKKVGIIGLSYREGVKEKAYSRSVDFIIALKKKGYQVYGIDPLYSRREIEKEFSIHYLSDFNKMDAIVVMNREFRYKRKLQPLKNKVVDIKNILV